MQTLSSTIITNPLLSIRIHHIVDGPGVPLLAQAKQIGRKESVLGHNDKVSEEAATGLYHADLAIRHADQPVNMHILGLTLYHNNKLALHQLQFI